MIRLLILWIFYTHEMKIHMASEGVGYDEKLTMAGKYSVFIVLARDCLEPVR